MSSGYINIPDYQSGGDAGVSSLNSLAGELSLLAGDNVSLTPDGQTITIAAIPTSPVGAAGGDLSGTYPNPMVATVGGSTASDIHTATALTLTSTSSNTAGTLVLRNGSGDFDTNFINMNGFGIPLTDHTSGVGVVYYGGQPFIFGGGADGYTSVFMGGAGNYHDGDGETDNTAIGRGALENILDGAQNTVIGRFCGSGIDHGNGNTGMGFFTLMSNDSGSYNVALGTQTMESNTSGSANTMVGPFVAQNNITGNYNVGIGAGSLYNLNSDANTGLGYQAGQAILSGTLTTFVGYNSGHTGPDSSNSVAVGAETQVASQSIALGYGANASTSNTLVAGSDSAPIATVNFGNGSLSATPSDVVIQPSSGIGTDIPGGSLTLAAGQGTGTGVSGSLIIKTAPAGSTGSSSNALATVCTYDAAGTLLSKHLRSTGVTPSITSGGGTSPSIAGNDTAGAITIGTGGTATTITITYAVSYTAAPIVVVSPVGNSATLYVGSTAGTFTVSSLLPFMASSIINYITIGKE